MASILVMHRRRSAVAPYKAALVILGAALTFLFGNNYDALLILLAMVCMDYATGLLAAVAGACLNSETGARGIAKKVGLLFLVALGHLTDRILGLNDLVLNICIVFIFANEGISIVENLARLGVPVPAKLSNVLEQIREKGNE